MSDNKTSELVKFRFDKAKSTLNEIEVHIQNELWATAVNRLYYACFYAVSALLASKDINSKTHSGTKQMFGLHFLKPGIISEQSGECYTIIFDLRLSGDYIDYFVFEPNEVLALLQPARDLIAEIQEVLSKP